MNRKVKLFGKVVFLYVLSIITTTAQAQHKGKPVSNISVLYAEAPLMKRMSFNPAMRIRVAVPEGQEAHYKGIKLQVNRAAVKDIERFDVIIRDDSKKSFLENAVLAGTLKPTSEIVMIPVDITCKPGLNHYWIIVVLKDTANIDDKVSLKVVSLTDANGFEQKVSKVINPAGDYHPSFTTRIGIAIRKAWDDSVHTYRIPGMVITAKGTLIAVYDIRYKSSRDLPGDIDVGMSRSVDGGKTWEPMRKIIDMGPPDENNGVGDPSVLFDPVTKRIWVAALWSKGNRSIAGSEPGLSPDTTGQLVLASSDDDGLTWSKPYSITSQVKDPKWHLYFQGPGNGIVMKNGTLVFPSQYWDESTKPGIPHSSIIYSEDHGKTWKSGTGAKYNTTESQVVETTPGTLMLNMRDNRGMFRSVATTTNMGKTWTEHQTSYMDLPDPVAMASFIKARVRIKGKMKDVLFFSNVSSETVRQNTTIKASLDMGESWPKEDQLLIDIRRTAGYSALTKVDDNTIGILYEGDNGELYFLRIPVSEIIKERPL